MPGPIARSLLAVFLFLSGVVAPWSTQAYVGRCARCGSAVDVDAFSYEHTDATTATGAIVSAETAAKPGTERGTRIEIKMDKGGNRVIHVHGDPRVYKGDRVRLYRDRIELL